MAEIDFKCGCGRILEVPLWSINEWDEDDPYDISPAIMRFDGDEDCHSGDGYVHTSGHLTCECGSRVHVVVKVDLEKKRAPITDDTVGSHVDIGVLFSGRQIHATDTGGDWPEQTYLYQDGDIFWFEQDNPGGTRSTIHGRTELKEYVQKLLPILFTPEELKELMTPAKE